MISTSSPSSTFFSFFFFFFNDTATTEIYTLSLHDALPISPTRPYPPAPSPAGSPGSPAARPARQACSVARPAPAGLGQVADESAGRAPPIYTHQHRHRPDRPDHRRRVRHDRPARWHVRHQRDSAKWLTNLLEEPPQSIPTSTVTGRIARITGGASGTTGLLGGTSGTSGTRPSG